jgi:hypothetical protein
MLRICTNARPLDWRYSVGRATAERKWGVNFDAPSIGL